MDEQQQENINATTRYAIKAFSRILEIDEEDANELVDRLARIMEARGYHVHHAVQHTRHQEEGLR